MRRRVAVAAVCWLALVAVAGLLRMGPRPGMLAVVVAAVATVLWLFLDVSVRSEAPRWRLVTDEAVRPPGEDPRLALLRRVVGGHLDSRQVDDHLHRQLAAAADRRLMARHGVTWQADPERAAALLGPELADYLGDAHRRLTVSQIDRLLMRIEDL